MKSRIRETLSQHSRYRPLALFGILCALLATLTVYAQYRGIGGQGGRGYGGYGGYGFRSPEPVELPEREVFPGNVFTFCRIRYTSEEGPRRGSRGGWATDYDLRPGGEGIISEVNFCRRLEELTTIQMSHDENGNIRHAILRLTDEDLFNYPFIYIVEPGALVFSEEEVEALRTYLLRGGFLMVDDFWGPDELANFEYEFSRVLSPEEYPLTQLPLTHEIFHCVFEIKEYPQVPAAGLWRPGSPTWERPDAKEVHIKGAFDKKGRMMVIVCHNTDLGDGWERENWGEDYFREMSAKKAYPMGVNIVVYAMTH